MNEIDSLKRPSAHRDLGQLFIVAAPSGGGKTSLVARLVQEMPQIEVSVSHTTRSKRPGEIEGVHYFYIDEATFQQMIVEHAFVEHACVFEHHYGTSFSQINHRLSQGIDVVLDIDWQGALQIKQRYHDSVSVFILPPSFAVLEARLRARQQDREQVIQQRMQQAQAEMAHYHEFDFLIINDDFDTAVSELKSIVMTQRLSTKRQELKQQKLLSFLLSKQ